MSAGLVLALFALGFIGLWLGALANIRLDKLEKEIAALRQEK